MRFLLVGLLCLSTILQVVPSGDALEMRIQRVLQRHGCAIQGEPQGGLMEALTDSDASARFLCRVFQFNGGAGTLSPLMRPHQKSSLKVCCVWSDMHRQRRFFTAVQPQDRGMIVTRLPRVDG